MNIKVYNASECLIFSGTYEEYKQLEQNHLINDSDRIVIE